ncbi:MAG: ATP-binding protein [Algicola sp.]|nr:ATP-binding protein [Algicola sp.]
MWTLEKIQQHIDDGIEENIRLDYKGAGSIAKSGEKKKEISKDVSAFANSDGGVIIYGVREFDEAGKTHLPEKIDPINANEFSKEWLEQIINSTISPTIPKVLITPIQVGKKEDNQVIYVVEIPKSNTAHQMNDKRYYRRYNFQSIAMEDWEIKDIINRLSKTQVELHFTYLPPKSFLEKHPDMPIIGIDVWAYNSGNKVIKYLDCYITGNAETAQNINKPYVKGNFEKHYSNIIEREATIGEDTFVISSEREVILPSTSRKIGHIEISNKFIEDQNIIKFQLSTEDNVKFIEFKGKEIIK